MVVKPTESADFVQIDSTLQGHLADQSRGFRRNARLPFFRHLRRQVMKFPCHRVNTISL
jgi:hypothetical protein